MSIPRYTSSESALRIPAPISRFRVWNFSAGTNENYNVYFDNLELLAVDSTDPVHWTSEILIIRDAEEVPSEDFSIDSFTPSADGSSYAVSFHASVSGATYSVYVCTNLLASPQAWTALEEESASSVADGGAVTLSFTTDLSRSFSAYRVAYTLP